MNNDKIHVARCFDCTNHLWTNNKEYNRVCVKTILDYCYSMLRVRHYLFLNEVYEHLGMPITRQGQIAGWVFDKDHEHDDLWTVSTYVDGDDNVYIEFMPSCDILHVIPEK